MRVNLCEFMYVLLVCEDVYNMGTKANCVRMCRVLADSLCTLIMCHTDSYRVALLLKRL